MNQCLVGITDSTHQVRKLKHWNCNKLCCATLLLRDHKLLCPPPLSWSWILLCCEAYVLFRWLNLLVTHSVLFLTKHGTHFINPETWNVEWNVPSPHSNCRLVVVRSCDHWIFVLLIYWKIIFFFCWVSPSNFFPSLRETICFVKSSDPSSTNFKSFLYFFWNQKSFRIQHFWTNFINAFSFFVLMYSSSFSIASRYFSFLPEKQPFFSEYFNRCPFFLRQYSTDLIYLRLIPLFT